MNQQAENRREFLKRASIAAVAVPFLLNCKSDTLAQKSNDDILSLIKKNARSIGAEGMGAIDAPKDVSWKTNLLTDSDKGEKMLISGNGFSAGRQNARAECFDLYLSHRHRRLLRQKKRRT